MKLGIIGLPNTGKSALFNSLTKAGVEASNYPFSTVGSNVGMALVPDHRLYELNKIYSAPSVVPATVEFVDIAGLVRGAGKGEGLGNKFLAYIREVDAIVHVVRCFEDENVVHVYSGIDPARDIETINFELIFADLETIEKRYTRCVKIAKSDKSAHEEAVVLEKLKSMLESGVFVRACELSDDERIIAKSLNLLTDKPVLYAANVSEDGLAENGRNSPYVAKIREIADNEGSEVFVVCAKLEEEITELDDDEKMMFLEELGVSESGLDRIIAASYRLLGLISFLTAGPKEVRAWTIKEGMKAPAAAGKIHTDIERGFIRAEVVAYDDLIKYGTVPAAKVAGTVRLEGKEYVVKDGDVILFRFNV